jgi:DNA-binding beta-propeller fold protein YncE
MRRVAMIDIPGRPGFDGVGIVGGNLIMTHPAASTVDVFNLAKRRVIAQIKDMKGADGIVVDEKGGKAYIANSDANEVAVVSTRDWTVERRIALKASPSALLLVPELNLLLTTNWRDLSVSEIDLAKNAPGNTVVLDGRPTYMAFDPGTKHILVSLEDQNAIAFLDPSLKLVKRIDLAASQPTGVALDARSRRLFVSVRYAVLALDADSGQELNRVAAPAGVDALWFEPSQNKLYAAAGGSVLVMNTKGRLEVDREWATDVKGHTVAVDAQKNMLYLPGGRDGRSKLLILRSMDKNAQEAAAQGVATAGTMAEKKP